MNFNFHSFFDQLLITSFTCLIVKHNMINMIEFVEIHDLQFRNLLLNPVKKFQNRIKFEQDKTSSTYIAFRTCVVSVTTYKKKKLHALPTFKISITISSKSVSVHITKEYSLYIYTWGQNIWHGQPFFLKSREGFLMAVLTGHGHPGPI